MSNWLTRQLQRATGEAHGLQPPRRYRFEAGSNPLPGGEAAAPDTGEGLAPAGAGPAREAERAAPRSSPTDRPPARSARPDSLPAAADVPVAVITLGAPTPDAEAYDATVDARAGEDPVVGAVAQGTALPPSRSGRPRETAAGATVSEPRRDALPEPPSRTDPHPVPASGSYPTPGQAVTPESQEPATFRLPPTLDREQGFDGESDRSLSPRLEVAPEQIRPEDQAPETSSLGLPLGRESDPHGGPDPSPPPRLDLEAGPVPQAREAEAAPSPPAETPTLGADPGRSGAGAPLADKASPPVGEAAGGVRPRGTMPSATVSAPALEDVGRDAPNHTSSPAAVFEAGPESVSPRGEERPTERGAAPSVAPWPSTSPPPKAAQVPTETSERARPSLSDPAPAPLGTPSAPPTPSLGASPLSPDARALLVSGPVSSRGAGARTGDNPGLKTESSEAKAVDAHGTNSELKATAPRHLAPSRRVETPDRLSSEFGARAAAHPIPSGMAADNERPNARNGPSLIPHSRVETAQSPTKTSVPDATAATAPSSLLPAARKSVSPGVQPIGREMAISAAIRPPAPAPIARILGPARPEVIQDAAPRQPAAHHLLATASASTARKTPSAESWSTPSLGETRAPGREGERATPSAETAPVILIEIGKVEVAPSPRPAPPRRASGPHRTLPPLELRDRGGHE